MDNQELLAAGRHVPGGDGLGAGVGLVQGCVLGNLTCGQGRIGVAQAAPGLVYVQEGTCIGLLSLHGNVAGEHFAIYLILYTLLGAILAGLIPHDGRTHVFVSVVLHAVIAQFFTLIDEGLVGNGEEDGGCLLLLGHVAANPIGPAVLVMVGEEEGSNGILALRLVVGDESLHRAGQVQAVLVVQGCAYQGAEAELEAGGKGLIVILLRGAVVVPLFGHHEDVAGMALLIGFVDAVVPFFQEDAVGCMVVRADAAADVLHGIQAQAVHAHIDPLVGRCRQILEAGVVLGTVHVTVIEVRHPVGEAAHIIEAFNVGVGEFDPIPARTREPHVSAFRYQVVDAALGGIAAAGAELGVPVVLRPHQKSVFAVHLHDEIERSVSVIHKFHSRAVATFLPQPDVPFGTAGFYGFVRFGNLHFGSTSGNLLPFAGIVVGSCEHGEFLVIGRRVGGNEIIVTVRTGCIGHRFLEPGVVLAAVVEDVVHIDLDILGVSRRNQILEIGLGLLCGVLPYCIQRVQGIIVVHIVGVIGAGGMGRTQPQGRNAHFVQVIQLALNTLEIADSVTVAVGEAVNEQLIGGGSPLGAVESRRRGNHVLRLPAGVATLLDSHLPGERTQFECHFSVPLGRCIVGRRYAHGGIAAARCGTGLDPAVGNRDGPFAGGRHLDLFHLGTVR